jgi:hypothetical protein
MENEILNNPNAQIIIGYVVGAAIVMGTILLNEYIRGRRK